MGSPLGPIFAGIFMCSLEEHFLETCPLSYHPLFYKRYVDDTFALFKSKYDAERFLEFINRAHPNIKFTMECENDNKLPFLDVLVLRQYDRFNTSVYRKKTFTGLGSNFYSHCFYGFKLNSLSTLIYRAFSLTSSWEFFHEEVQFLHKYFKSNYFPTALFHRYVFKILNSVFIPKVSLPTVPKLTFYSNVPLINDKNFYDVLRKLVSNYIPAIRFNTIPTNPLTMGSLFKFKDKLDPLMTSCVVYKFNCPRCNLGTYVGSTQRLLRVRIDCHNGVSYRTGSKLTNPEFSCIRQHANKCKHKIQYKDFEILGRAPNSKLLTILESLHIKQVVPQLNTQSSSTTLYLT